MVWSLDLDDFRNVCGEGHHPLMNTVKKVLGPVMNDEERAARAGTAAYADRDNVELDVRSPQDDFLGTNVVSKSSKENKDYKVVCCEFSVANWTFSILFATAIALVVLGCDKSTVSSIFRLHQLVS